MKPDIFHKTLMEEVSQFWGRFIFLIVPQYLDCGEHRTPPPSSVLEPDPEETQVLDSQLGDTS